MTFRGTRGHRLPHEGADTVDLVVGERRVHGEGEELGEDAVRAVEGDGRHGSSPVVRHVVERDEVHRRPDAFAGQPFDELVAADQ